jgi:hypothetical protein
MRLSALRQFLTFPRRTFNGKQSADVYKPPSGFRIRGVCVVSCKNLMKDGAVGEVILLNVVVVKFFENLSIVPVHCPLTSKIRFV